MPARRPLIGVIAKQTRDQLAGIGETYLHALEAAGATPMLLHLTSTQPVIDDLYARCDALLFAGGGDVAGHYFGEEHHPNAGAPEVLRDAVELALVRRAAADRLPIAGICRGLQVINIALGGTIYQDLDSQLPTALDHRASSKHPARAYLAHPLRIAADSWLATRLGTTAIAANTHHHQSLKAIAPGLRVTATAPDGVVEAAEGTGAQFIVAVQCHPEDLWDGAEPRWRGFFDGFVAEVQRRNAAV
jgi:putative glutamine amidotransferase